MAAPKKKAASAEVLHTTLAVASQQGSAPPESSAVADPAPGSTMDPGSGAFIEPAILDGIDADHPAVENNPRKGTAAVQNGADWNDPTGKTPNDEGFVGQGLDRSVYGL